MPLRRFAWNYTDPDTVEAFYLPSILSQWHRARKLGLEITSLEVNGQVVAPDALERLNFWLSANGAWSCTLLSHFEAERVLERILRQGGETKIGPVSGGRWPSSSRAEEVFL